MGTLEDGHWSWVACPSAGAGRGRAGGCATGDLHPNPECQGWKEGWSPLSPLKLETGPKNTGQVSAGVPPVGGPPALADLGPSAPEALGSRHPRPHI